MGNSHEINIHHKDGKIIASMGAPSSFRGEGSTVAEALINLAELIDKSYFNEKLKDNDSFIKDNINNIQRERNEFNSNTYKNTDYCVSMPQDLSECK